MLKLRKENNVKIDNKYYSLAFIISFCFFVLIGVSSATPILAYVMSNNDYYLQSDSINFGGGLGSSTDYNLEDTLGEVGTGYSSNTEFSLSAGYQQSGGSKFLTLTVPTKVVLSPNIYGVSGGIASATSSVHVTTNNQSGYTLMINASTSPAMQSTSTGSSFANYTSMVSSTPDFNWFVSSTDSEFGFSADGGDIVQKFRDNGSTCNQVLDSATPNTCWSVLTTSTANISYSNSSNFISGGSDTVLKFKAESGSGHIQAPGIYQAPIIITAYMN